MEVASHTTSEINILPAETVPVVTVNSLPYSTETPISTVQGNTHQLVNLYQDGSVINSSTQPSYILTTNPDGSSTILLDASQLSLFTGQAYPIYDGTKVFQFATQDVTESPTVTIITEPEFSEPVEAQELLTIEKTQATLASVEQFSNEKHPSIDDVVQPPYKKGQYKCSICEMEFEKPDRLERHKRKHAEEKPYKCGHCGAAFNLETNLILHEATHATSNPTCPECKKTFSRMASLKAHILLHEVEENLMCADCGEEFSTQYKFNNHQCVMKEIVLEEEEATFGCKKCSRKFIKLMHLKEHMKVHRKLKASLSRKKYKMYVDRSSFPHKCFTCGKQFKKPSQLVRHVRIHTGEKPFKCDICSKAFNQKGALHVHMTRHNGVRPHLCSFCPATFSQRGNLRAHIKRVHMIDDSEKIHQCSQCSCIFKKLGSLHTHMRRFHSDAFTVTNECINDRESDVNKQVNEVIGQLLDMAKHTSDQPNQTEQQIQKIAENTKVNADILQQALENSGLASNNEVEKDSQDRRGLMSKSLVMTVTDTATGKINKHLVRKVGNVRFYQCVYCKREFKKPSDLIRHIRIHTHERPYKCHMCFRAFSVKSTLTAHIRTHSGEKPFRCNTCHKAFSSQGSLRVHILLHTGAKPYACCQCGKSFRTSGHRRSHSLSHMKENNSPTKKQKKIPKPSDNNVNVPDIPLPEPIFISNEGYVQSFVNTNASQTIVELPADRPYQCHICLKGFKKSSHLKQHIRSHSGEKPYQCNQCERHFVSNGVLKAHIKTHSGIKAFRCDICESSFTTRGSLKRHLLIHTDERPFMCPYCQKTFKTTTSCRKHMRGHRHEFAESGSSGVTVTIIPEMQISALEDAQPREVIQNLPAQCMNGLEPTVTASDGEKQDESTAAVLAHQPFEQQESVLLDAMPPETHVMQASLNKDVNQGGVRVEEVAHAVENGEQNFDQTHSLLHIENLEQPVDSSVAANVSYTSSSFVDEPLMTTSLPSLLQQVGNTVTISDGNCEENQSKISKQRTRKTYSCLQCHKEFKKSSHLVEHIRSHTGEKPYRCTLCGRMFVSGSVLRNHMKTHDKTREFICTVCNTGFTTKGSHTRHMSIHEAEKLLQCSQCSESFQTSALYQQHVATCHQDVPTGVEVINVSEQERPDVLRSLLVKRARNPPIQIPEEQTEQLAKQNPEEADTISEKVLIAAAVEKNKVKEVKGDNSEENSPKYPHACMNCTKSFKKPSDLVRHIRIHTGEKPYSCESCNKRFTVKSTLDSHMKTHSGERNFSCHVCCSQFATKGSLKVHMRLHTGSKPFKCPHCHLFFRTSGHRKSHISSHFKSSVQRRQKSEKKVEDALSDPLCSKNVEKLPAQSLSPNSESVLATANVEDVQEIPSLLQNGDGIQLQLTPNLVGQSIQITGVDPNMLSKPIHIDAGLLQQLQHHVNINITISPSSLPGQLNGQPDTIVDALQSQNLATEIANTGSLPTTGTITFNPNVVIQQLGFVAAKPQAKSLPASTMNGENYSIACSNQPSCTDDITVMSNMVGHAISRNENVVYQTENIEENSVVIEEHLVNVNEGNGMQIHDLVMSKNAESGSEQLANMPGDQAKFFVCTICKSSFSKKTQLAAHKRIHREEPIQKATVKKIYQCTYCSVTFAQSKSLQAHIKRLHAVS